MKRKIFFTAIITFAIIITISYLVKAQNRPVLVGLNFMTGEKPTGVTVGDFNRDKLFDIAITNEKDDNVSVLIGNGDNTFQPQRTFSVGKEPSAVLTADFNRDGISDLAVTNRDSQDVSHTSRKRRRLLSSCQKLYSGKRARISCIGRFQQ